MTYNPHKGHRDRLKKRFLQSGIDDFEDHNKLELLLFYAIPQKDTNPIAHELLDTFGSLSNVLDAPFEELIKVKGISESSAVLLKLIPPLSRSYLNDKYKNGFVINSTEQAGEFLMPKFIGLTTEDYTPKPVQNPLLILL